MTDAPPPRADREAIARVIKDIARRWIYQTAHNGPDHLCGGIGNEAASAVLTLGVLHPSREEGDYDRAWLEGWRCPSCKWCSSYAIVDEAKPGGGFRPGPGVRCIDCKAECYPRQLVDRLRERLQIRWGAPAKDGVVRAMVDYDDLREAIDALAHPSPSAIAEAERALAEWTPELEAARIKLCQNMVERADAYRGSVGRLLLEGEMAFTLLGDIIARASAALRAIPAMTGAADPRNREEPNGWRPTHRHVKRGTLYRLVSSAVMQTETPVGDNEFLALYQGDDGLYWVRPAGEFNDGRFEPVPPPPSQESEG